ncbi:phospholipase D-like domain-containing protein [Paenibacillus sp. IHB B 3415]|uniref:phospholipase D-like domain-containing protein n=1 Tax=Paenibacillus sp. IHB B 3415 TaxID=867080 RepID=UPI00069C6D9C|nr:phospholipase D-like domain-containing protein [Paenibacillus sp. IHB B 3415]
MKSSPDENIQGLIFSLIVSAKKRIYMETPYFIPDPGVMLATETAIMGGVDVRIIIPSTPDKKLVYNCTISYVHELVQLGLGFITFRKGFSMPKY